MGKRTSEKTHTDAAAEDGAVARMRTIGKWAGVGVGILTTVLGVAFNVDRLGDLLTDRAQRRASYTQLFATVDQQLVERKYDLAWASIEKAIGIAETQGWKLRGLPSLDDAQAKQADVAMAWLRDIRLVGSDKTFTAVVERLEPALQRKELKATGSRKADLVAHLGYADFLRLRDGQGGLDPAVRYEEALRIDPGNPFANAMLGHWRIWKGGGVAESAKLFDTALAAKRESTFARKFQLAAFANRHDDDADFAFLRAVNGMRKSGEAVDEWTRSQADFIYYRHGYTPEKVDRVIHAMQAGEHLETVRWLLAGQEDESKRLRYEYYAALLEEAAGEIGAARDHLVALRARLPQESVYRTGLESALHRLSSR